MQKKFIAREQQRGVGQEEYYNPDEGTELDGYHEKFTELSNRLIDLAHAEKGSSR